MLAVVLVLDEGSAVVRVVDDLAVLALSTWAAVCSGLAARATRGRIRTAWTFMAAGLAAWAVGDLIWLVTENVLHVSPFPSPADLF